MSLLRKAVRYAPFPVFVLLAGINYMLEAHGGGHAGHAMAASMPPGEMPMGGSILGSMWLMYLVMGLAHAGPWLPGGKSEH